MALPSGLFGTAAPRSSSTTSANRLITGRDKAFRLAKSSSGPTLSSRALASTAYSCAKSATGTAARKTLDGGAGFDIRELLVQMESTEPDHAVGTRGTPPESGRARTSPHRG